MSRQVSTALSAERRKAISDAIVGMQGCQAENGRRYMTPVEIATVLVTTMSAADARVAVDALQLRGPALAGVMTAINEYEAAHPNAPPPPSAHLDGQALNRGQILQQNREIARHCIDVAFQPLYSPPGSPISSPFVEDGHEDSHEDSHADSQAGHSASDHQQQDDAHVAMSDVDAHARSEQEAGSIARQQAILDQCRARKQHNDLAKAAEAARLLYVQRQAQPLAAPAAPIAYALPVSYAAQQPVGQQQVLVSHEQTIRDQHDALVRQSVLLQHLEQRNAQLLSQHQAYQSVPQSLVVPAIVVHPPPGGAVGPMGLSAINAGLNVLQVPGGAIPPPIANIVPVAQALPAAAGRQSARSLGAVIAGPRIGKRPGPAQMRAVMSPAQAAVAIHDGNGVVGTGRDETITSSIMQLIATDADQAELLSDTAFPTYDPSTSTVSFISWLDSWELVAAAKGVKYATATMLISSYLPEDASEMTRRAVTKQLASTRPLERYDDIVKQLSDFYAVTVARSHVVLNTIMSMKMGSTEALIEFLKRFEKACSSCQVELADGTKEAFLLNAIPTLVKRAYLTSAVGYANDGGYARLRENLIALYNLHEESTRDDIVASVNDRDIGKVCELLRSNPSLTLTGDPGSHTMDRLKKVFDFADASKIITAADIINQIQPSGADRSSKRVKLERTGSSEYSTTDREPNVTYRAGFAAPHVGLDSITSSTLASESPVALSSSSSSSSRVSPLTDLLRTAVEAATVSQDTPMKYFIDQNQKLMERLMNSTGSGSSASLARIGTPAAASSSAYPQVVCSFCGKLNHHESVCRLRLGFPRSSVTPPHPYGQQYGMQMPFNPYEMFRSLPQFMGSPPSYPPVSSYSPSPFASYRSSPPTPSFTPSGQPLLMPGSSSSSPAVSGSIHPQRSPVVGSPMGPPSNAVVPFTGLPHSTNSRSPCTYCGMTGHSISNCFRYQDANGLPSTRPANSNYRSSQGNARSNQSSGQPSVKDESRQAHAVVDQSRIIECNENSLGSPSLKTMQVWVTVYNLRLHALVDSGAVVTLMSYDCYNRIPGRPPMQYVSGDRGIRGIVGQPFHTMGYVDLPVTVHVAGDSRRQIIRANVVDGIALPFILGMDTIGKFIKHVAFDTHVMTLQPLEYIPPVDPSLSPPLLVEPLAMKANVVVPLVPIPIAPISSSASSASPSDGSTRASPDPGDYSFASCVKSIMSLPNAVSSTHIDDDISSSLASFSRVVVAKGIPLPARASTSVEFALHDPSLADVKESVNMVCEPTESFDRHGEVIPIQWMSFVIDNQSGKLANKSPNMIRNIRVFVYNPTDRVINLMAGMVVGETEVCVILDNSEVQSETKEKVAPDKEIINTNLGNIDRNRHQLVRQNDRLPPSLLQTPGPKVMTQYGLTVFDDIFQRNNTVLIQHATDNDGRWDYSAGVPVMYPVPYPIVPTLPDREATARVPSSFRHRMPAPRATTATDLYNRTLAATDDCHNEFQVLDYLLRVQKKHAQDDAVIHTSHGTMSTRVILPEQAHGGHLEVIDYVQVPFECQIDTEMEEDGPQVPPSYPLHTVDPVRPFPLTIPLPVLALFNFDSADGLHPLPLIVAEVPTSPFEDQVRINPELDAADVEAIRRLVRSNYPAFAINPAAPDSVPDVRHHIDTGTARPVRQRPYRMPPNKIETIEKMVSEYVRHHQVEPCQSPWSSPPLLVGKADGSARLCIDFRELNEVTKKDAYVMPRIDDILWELKDAVYSSAFDLASGFHHILIAEGDRGKTAFGTASGQYQWRVMPFGLTNAPATFQRLMDQIFLPMKKFGVHVYFDDVCVATPGTLDDHLKIVDMVLKECIARHLSIKASKAKIAFTRMVFLGHEISHGTIRADPKRCAAIAKMKQPYDVSSLRSFLGMANYYRQYIAGFAALASPLYELLRKRVDFVMTPQRVEAFLSLRSLLISPAILHCPDHTRRFLLQTDASSIGIGGVLSQIFDDGEHPVSFVSRKLLPAEQNYFTTELECLAIVWCVRQFELFLNNGSEFSIMTDHNPLAFLKQAKAGINKRCLRWSIFLSSYPYVIKYRPGKKNGNADVVSRLPLDIDPSTLSSVEGEVVLSATHVDVDELTRLFTVMNDRSSMVMPILMDPDGNKTNRNTDRYIDIMLSEYPTCNARLSLMPLIDVENQHLSIINTGRNIVKNTFITEVGGELYTRECAIRLAAERREADRLTPTSLIAEHARVAVDRPFFKLVFKGHILYLDTSYPSVNGEYQSHLPVIAGLLLGKVPFRNVMSEGYGLGRYFEYGDQPNVAILITNRPSETIHTRTHHGDEPHKTTDLGFNTSKQYPRVLLFALRDIANDEKLVVDQKYRASLEIISTAATPPSSPCVIAPPRPIVFPPAAPGESQSQVPAPVSVSVDTDIDMTHARSRGAESPIALDDFDFDVGISAPAGVPLDPDAYPPDTQRHIDEFGHRALELNDYRFGNDYDAHGEPDIDVRWHNDEIIRRMRRHEVIMRDDGAPIAVSHIISQLHTSPTRVRLQSRSTSTPVGDGSSSSDGHDEYRPQTVVVVPTPEVGIPQYPLFDPDKLKYVAEQQRLDPILKPIIEFIESHGKKVPSSSKDHATLVRQADRYTIRGDHQTLYRLTQPKIHRVFASDTHFLSLAVPASMYNYVLRTVHDANGHFGEQKTYARLVGRFYWDGMYDAVTAYCRQCLACQSKKVPRKKNVTFKMSMETASYPLERMCVDTLGPFSDDTKGFKFCIIFLDYFTRWAICVPVREQSAETTARVFMEQVVYKYGAPAYLLSDRGSNYMSALMKEVKMLTKTRSLATTAYHPQTNGLVERFNHTIVQILSLIHDHKKEDWSDHVHQACYAYNISKQSTTTESPFFLMYGREPQELGDEMTHHREHSYESQSQYVNNMLDRMSWTWQLVRSQLALNESKKLQSNRTVKSLITFKVGERVWLLHPLKVSARSITSKFLHPYVGPYTILRQTSPVNYEIKHDTHKKAPTMIVNVNRLKPYHEPLEMPPSHKVMNAPSAAERRPYQPTHHDDVIREARRVKKLSSSSTSSSTSAKKRKEIGPSSTPPTVTVHSTADIRTGEPKTKVVKHGTITVTLHPDGQRVTRSMDDRNTTRPSFVGLDPSRAAARAAEKRDVYQDDRYVQSIVHSSRTSSPSSFPFFYPYSRLSPADTDVSKSFLAVVTDASQPSRSL